MSGLIVSTNQEILIHPGPLRFSFDEDKIFSRDEIADQLTALARMTRNPDHLEMLITVAVSLGLEVRQ